MEYEKPATAPVFPKKLRNRSHSLSFSANVAYDGVFSSPATKNPPQAIDYGEIFLGSCPSSSIPFLDVPELNEEKIQVDARSSKLDYSSVFGGFEGCDFTVSPEELIIKTQTKNPAKDKRNRKKPGNSPDVSHSAKVKNQISSPDVSVKQFNVSYHRTAPRNENGMNGETQVAQVHAVSGYTQSVDNPCPLPKMESRKPISSVEKEPYNGGHEKVADCNKVQVDILPSNGSKKRSSRSEAEFEIMFGRSGSNTGDSFGGNVCKTDRNVKRLDVMQPSSLQNRVHGDKEGCERSVCPKLGVPGSFRSEDADSPCSPPYFDEESDSNPDAAASSAALKKAIEEAQLRIDIAKQMMEKKKAVFRSRAKPRSSDSLKAEDIGNIQCEQQTERCRNIETQSVGEMVNSSKQEFGNVAKRSVGEVVNSFVQSFLNMGEHIVGEVVNSSKRSSLDVGKRNAGEAVNSSEQSLADKGDRIVGESANSSERLISNAGEENIGEVANSSNQSSPNVGKQTAGEALNSFGQSFADTGEENIGEAVNSSELSIPNVAERNVGEVVNSSEQSFPYEGEQNVGEMVSSSEQSIPSVAERDACEVMNSSERSIPNEGEQNVGEKVNSLEQSISNAGERDVGEAVNSSEQLIANVEERNAGDAANSLEQSFPDAGKGNAGEAVNSSEQSIWNDGDRNVDEVVNSCEQSILNVEERDAGEAVNSSEQSMPNVEEQDAGEAVNSSDQTILKARERNVGEAANSFEESSPNEVEKNVGDVVEQSLPNDGERDLRAIPDEEELNVAEATSSSNQSSLDQGEQQVKRARRLWEASGDLLKSTLHHMREEAREREAMIKEEEEHARKARKHWELPGGMFASNGEMQKVTESSFYSFGQLGNKIKCVVEAFTGSKVAQTSEAEGTEHVTADSREISYLTHEVRDQEGEEKNVFDREEILGDSSDMETCEREVEEILKPDDGQSSTQRDENAESTMCDLKEKCSQKEELETEWYEQSENASEPYDASYENPNTIHEILDQEGEKESLFEPREKLVLIPDTKTYEREVLEIPRTTQSTSKTHIDENAVSFGSSILGESASVSGEAPEGNEKEHKTPRRRRVWKASEDVYDMIKGLKRYNRAWQIEDEEKEMMKRCLREQSARVDDGIDAEETEAISELPSDSGLQENWYALKQMFRQMFQTVDTKREDETCCFAESEQNQIEIHERAEEMDRKSYLLTGSDIVNDSRKHDTKETVRTGYEGYVHTGENTDSELALKTDFDEEDGEVEEQSRPSFVFELIEEELEAMEMANDGEEEDVAEVSEADELDQEAFELYEIKEQEASQAGMLEHDQSETRSSSSDEKFEKQPHEEQAEETTLCSNIDDDTRGPSFETGPGDSDTGEVESESNKSGLDDDGVEFIDHLNENDDNLKLGASEPPCKPEEAGNTKQSFEDNEGRKRDPGCPEASCSSKEDVGDNLSQSSANEERSATSDASQNKEEHEEKHTKKIDEAKERIMVERAIREARERAFVEAKGRAERAAAMEKANAGTHRRTASEARGRSEKASIEVNDKISEAEKASMQAKLRAERAAVERALAEARERALEKALSGKAASQASSNVGKSHSFSSSGTENRSSAPPSSSNQSGNVEPAERCKARSERHQRTSERAAKALAEKKVRDLNAQKEQAERNRLAETLDAEVKRWSSGKEGNLRALLSTLQYILGPESGWKPIHLTDLVSSSAARKAYLKATLSVHPDKLQQRGATMQQKYICEKVFDLLKEAWNKFSAEER